MKPPPFQYFDPRTVEETISLLSEHGSEAKILAGGQSLMPLLNMRLARPAVIVDVNRIDGLDYIREDGGGLAIGALTRQRAVERSEAVARRQPLLRAATQSIAHPQIRNRGTIGGSIAHADPAAEYPAVALLLDAELRITGPKGERTVAAEDFFVTYLTTTLNPAEMLIEVRLPGLPPRTGWSFLEVARRRGDFALAGAGATMTLSADGRCAESRLAAFGVAATPVRLRSAEQALAGQLPAAALFAEVARQASDELEEPLSDVHATAEYRRQLARVLTQRVLEESAERARNA